MEYKRTFYDKYIKRCMDVIVSSVAIVLLSPIWIVVSILVRINLGSPIFFVQQRPGKDGKIFKLIKFRSMTNKVDKNGSLLPDSDRLTRFGRVLRSTSMDELPELINILKGDMSIVGPRPLLVRYLDYYNERDRHRMDVRPGLTGLAQVSGRNAITWDERFRKDIEYVENISFINDIRIIGKTVKKIFVREGIEFNNSENIDDYFRNNLEV